MTGLMKTGSRGSSVDRSIPFTGVVCFSCIKSMNRMIVNEVKVAYQVCKGEKHKYRNG